MNNNKALQSDRFQSSLDGKIGIVTGGTSGFGYEIATALVRRGASVAVFSIDKLSSDRKSALRDVRAESGGDFEFYTADITKPETSERIVSRTVDRFGTPDFLICNAGAAKRFEMPLMDIPVSELASGMQYQFDIFPIAFATLSLAVARSMASKYEHIEPDETGHRPGSGSIVVTLSETAFGPLRDDLIAYAAAKRATLSVMETLSAVLGPKNIRVNGIAPGFADTAGPRKFYERFPNIRADIDSKAHLKPPFMHPGAVVPAVVYLLTDNYVTGDVIALDGGYRINLNRYFQE